MTTRGDGAERDDHLAYLGAASLAVGLLTLGVGLVRSRAE
jgi:hypothetical protein